MSVLKQELSLYKTLDFDDVISVLDSQRFQDNLDPIVFLVAVHGNGWYFAVARQSTARWAMGVTFGFFQDASVFSSDMITKIWPSGVRCT